jgi:anti-sigma regulatory factor (Ser/Thr protein kinase)
MTSSHDGYRHLALYHSSLAELAKAVVPFLDAGQQAGKSAVLAADDATVAAVKATTNGDTRLAVMDPQELFRNPNHALIACQRVAEAELARGAAGVQILARMPHGRAPTQWAEWASFDYVANEVLADCPVELLCLYDTASLPSQVLDLGLHTHPLLLDGGQLVDNERYSPDLDPIMAMVKAAHHDLEATPATLALGQVISSAQARAAVRQMLNDGAAGASPGAADFITALSEVVQNALTHGGPPVRLCLWVTADRVVCTVTDSGTGVPDPLTGLGPRPDLNTGSRAGLWLARQLTDTLILRQDKDTFTVLLGFRVTA